MSKKQKQNPPKGRRSYKVYSEKYALILLLILFLLLSLMLF